MNAQIAPDEAFAEYARYAMSTHDEWDSPHFFQTLHYKDGSVYPAVIACIVPDFPPEHYPVAMAKIAGEDAEENTDPPACGYLLQFEAFGAPDATPQEQRDRTIHKRADRDEICSVMLVSVEGKVWQVIKRRATGEIIESSWNALLPPAEIHSEKAFYRALVAAGYAQGLTHFGLIPPIIGSPN